MPTLVILPISVPYLEPHGDNWAIFVMRFRSTMKAACRWAYFTGEEPLLRLLSFLHLCVPPDRVTASTGLYSAYADISMVSRRLSISYFPL